MKEDSHREKGFPSLEGEVVPTREAAGRSLLVEEAVLPMMAAADRILLVEEAVLPTMEEVLPTLPVALVVVDILVVVVLVVEDNHFAGDLVVAGDSLRFEEEAWALLLGAGFVVLVGDSHSVVVLVVDSPVVDIRLVVLAEEDNPEEDTHLVVVWPALAEDSSVVDIRLVVLVVDSS